ncbi:MAG: TlpA family protein disulfide reductase [Saprospiraceae bacterium]|nr:TlpA family protein disulfide reductase [Saprospiraceae bacterium]MBK7525208.1 TlpA family protein disulfide reductase [Saprospiraceae bacterium]MBK8370232.1 TlpA family protein disulfide reductase [Saprospiraceae bacterium]MBK8817881.1 TlpA family protein disulfide reductase [Saprospiraceae bacterium]MBK8854823.1 TlpA family protein disulfide reductase [Saprospiraceae bacterium]
MTKYLLSLTLLFSLFLMQCKNKEDFRDSGVAEFKGKILNPGAPGLTVEINGVIKEIPISQDGSFNAKLDVPKAGIYKMMHGPQGMFLPIYFQPGETTVLNAEGTNLMMSAKFEGDNKIENSYLMAKMMNEANLIDIDQTTLFTLPEAEFLKKAEEVKTKLIDFKKEFQKQNGVFNTFFEEIINQDITYQVTNLKMYYPIYYNYLMKTTDFVPSESFYSFFQGLDINNENNLFSEHFKAFVPLYLNHQAKIKNDSIKSYEPSGIDKLEILSETITNQKIKEEISFKIMEESFQTKLAEAFAMYDVYMNQAQDINKKKAIENLHAQWLPFKPGSIAPSFSGVDKNGKSYTKESLKGKVIYIDVWATWCGPCLAELPHLEILQEKFKKNGNVVFVSISIDQNKEPWRKMLESKKMKGIQIYSEGAWNSEIIANYKISGIPRFIIIDKEGKLVDGNAPRPSNPETATILSTLI